MARNVEKKGLDVNGKIVNIAADIHMRSWHVTALGEGVVVVTGSVARRRPCVPGRKQGVASRKCSIAGSRAGHYMTRPEYTSCP